MENSPEACYPWAVPEAHPVFAGHFPGRPIVPGVMLLDQAIRFAETWLGRADLAWQVGNAKFLSPVAPGETLDFRFKTGPRGSLSFSVSARSEPPREVAVGSLTPPAS